MQELDVSKPMIIEHKDLTKKNVRHLSTAQGEYGINHLFEVTDSDWDYYLVTDKFGLPVCGTVFGKVVNAPEPEKRYEVIVNPNDEYPYSLICSGFTLANFLTERDAELLKSMKEQEL